MRRSLLAIPALLTAFAMPLVAVAPASATSPDLSTATFDCTEYIWVPWSLSVPLYEPSITITFENCPTEYRLAESTNSGNASTSAGDIDDQGNAELDPMTVDGLAEVYIIDENQNAFAVLQFIEPHEIPNPTGVQLADTSQFIPADAPSTIYGTASQAANDSDIEIGGINDCDIAAGEHIYATQSFTVATSGKYTFRVTGVDPLSHYFMPFGIEGTELDDPMVALYSTFNTLDTDSGVVGCNDDLNNLEFGGHDYEDNDHNITAQGDFVEGHFSYFSKNLNPGNYMLVFTTYDVTPADAWAAEAPSGGTVYFDVWGPEGGLDLTDVDPIAEEPDADPSALASTGVEPSFALWTAMFMIAAGAAIMFARRRRV